MKRKILLLIGTILLGGSITACDSGNTYKEGYWYVCYEALETHTREMNDALDKKVDCPIEFPTSIVAFTNEKIYFGYFNYGTSGSSQYVIYNYTVTTAECYYKKEKVYYKQNDFAVGYFEKNIFHYNSVMTPGYDKATYTLTNFKTGELE